METDPRVRVLRLSRNFGSYAAIKAGFDHARGQAAISISADLQDPPELFRDFTAKWQESYHIVWGVREKRDDPWSKTFLANIFYRLVRRLALDKLGIPFNASRPSMQYEHSMGQLHLPASILRSSWNP